MDEQAQFYFDKAVACSDILLGSKNVRRVWQRIPSYLITTIYLRHILQLAEEYHDNIAQGQQVFINYVHAILAVDQQAQYKNTAKTHQLASTLVLNSLVHYREQLNAPTLKNSVKQQEFCCIDNQSQKPL